MKTASRFHRACRWFHYSALIILPFSAWAATNDLTSALQKGLFEEEANHNLEAAAQAYQTVSAQFDQDRKLAATAIFRLGEVYRKQSKTNEAVGQYERIVREFSDQQTLVTLSRQNLVALGGSAQTRAAVVANTATVDNLQSQYALLKAQLEQARKETNFLTIAKLLDDEDLRETVRQARTVIRLPEEQQKIFEAAAARALDYAEKRLSILQSAIAQAGAGQSLTTADKETSPTADDEEKEIRRIQVMIQNSPDLINAGQNPPIFPAVEAGYLRVVRFLLDRGAEVNIQSQGKTPLHVAAQRGQKAMVELLLSRGAEVNARNTDNNAARKDRTPLHEAAEEGFQGVVEVLLANKADPNARDAGGNNPLHLAGKQNRANVISLLTAALSDVNAENSSGITALAFVAAYGNVNSVKVLLDAKADVNAGKRDVPLLAAINSRQEIPVIELLLRRGANPNLAGIATQRGIALGGRGYSTTPLRAAVERGEPEIVKLLLQFKAEVNAVDEPGRTPLSHAIGNTNIVKLLLDAKADPNLGTAESPLLLAVRSENPMLTELLLRAGASPNLETECAMLAFTPSLPPPSLSYPGLARPATTARRAMMSTGQRGKRTPLQVAVLEDHPAMVKLMLQFKGDAKASGPEGFPLVLSALDNAEMLKALLEAGADANANDGKGHYALITAAAAGNSTAVDLLLGHGARTEVRDEHGFTPLLVTIGSGSTNCVAALLAAGANVHTRSNDEWSALHSAVGYGSKTILQLLLAKGANPNVRNKEGRTPLDLTKPQPGPNAGFAPPRPGDAPRASAQELADLLRQHGALDELPFFDRIEVRRSSAGFSGVAFPISTNGWNEFSLLELLALHYGFIFTDRNAVWEVNKATVPSKFWRAAACQFPELSRVIIRRADSGGQRWTERTVSVAQLLETGDCAQDVQLQPGDIVEIPEADHPVNEQWPGLASQPLSNLLHCVSRTVTVSIKGTPTAVLLTPQLKPTGSLGPYGEPMNELTKGSFMVKSVLAQSRLLRASSDLSRVKVTRQTGTGGKKQEWMLNCGNGSDPDLWLRDGDVIEVPDKP